MESEQFASNQDNLQTSHGYPNLQNKVILSNEADYALSDFHIRNMTFGSPTIVGQLPPQHISVQQAQALAQAQARVIEQNNNNGMSTLRHEKTKSTAIINWSNLYGKFTGLGNYFTSFEIPKSMYTLWQISIIFGFAMGTTGTLHKTLTYCAERESHGYSSFLDMVWVSQSTYFVKKMYFVLSETLKGSLLGTAFGALFPFNIIGGLIYCYKK